MAPKNYRTVKTAAEAEQTIHKSRFIAYVFHAESEADADDFIAKLRREHYKATHVCSAYVLGTTPPKEKASDDGEPSGTAGRPILDVIKRRDLQNVGVAVVRYFGGVKLGAGGLIRAYAGSASLVLDQARIVGKIWSDTVCVVLPYPMYGGMLQKLENAGHPAWKPVRARFAETVTLDFEIPVEETEAFTAFVTDHSAGQADISTGEPKWVDTLVSAPED
jgi:uncharacterized YigZ family protein